MLRKCEPQQSWNILCGKHDIVLPVMNKEVTPAKAGITSSMRTIHVSMAREGCIPTDTWPGFKLQLALTSLGYGWDGVLHSRRAGSIAGRLRRTAHLQTPPVSTQQA